MLGAQNRECLEQAAKEPASKGQASIARHLDGGDQEGRRGCIRCVRRILWRQVRQGRRVLDERPRGAARILRLPCRCLETSVSYTHLRAHETGRNASNGPIKG